MSSTESNIGAELTLTSHEAHATAIENVGTETEVPSSQLEEAPSIAPVTAVTQVDDDPVPPPVLKERARTIFPPNCDVTPTWKRGSVFLAGTIDQGTAPEWQRDLTDALCDLPIDLYNPRRPNWKPNADQTKENEYFRRQVNWELDMLDDVDVIAMYLVGEKSPISLLELGIYCKSKKLIVCCEKKFYRRGNVEITCDRFGIKLVGTLEELEAEVRHRLVARSKAAAALHWLIKYLPKQLIAQVRSIRSHYSRSSPNA